MSCSYPDDTDNHKVKWKEPAPNQEALKRYPTNCFTIVRGFSLTSKLKSEEKKSNAVSA